MTFLRTAAGLLLGLLLSVPIHVAALSFAMIFCVATGLAPDGRWPEGEQNAFVISFALWQWLYLLPIAVKLSRRRSALAVGLALSGIPAMLIALFMLIGLLLKT